MRIRKGDLVEVISGNDKGTRGKVLRVIPKRNRLVVQGVNLRWKHMRKSQQAPQGGRLRREAAVHFSNVMLYDEGAGRRTRLGSELVDGKKTRIARVTGKEAGTGAAAEESAKVAKKAAKKTPAKAKAAAKKTTKKADPKHAKTSKKATKKTGKE